ncbi:hypothetical protein BDV96DRAFT_602604 [Lophiotrema nucula]|uniref:Uncharacterized protein n=1 Tax=Lophiotrema nucula TaxID=690887 RepID=A0A6A5YYC5_9PLEO|nr:hypothetical protein BDV96DRAFT_602604 [Lophiotrema nucula]
MASTEYESLPCLPPKLKVLDWDEKELKAVRAANLPYAIRSAKYPRTKKNPSRCWVIINDTHSYSIHKVLLKSFSTKCAALFKENQNLHNIRINGIEPVTSIPAWEIFTEWLYMLDKVPLPDYTPLRRAAWRSRHIKDACFLASFLGATKFEKYLLRIIFKEVHEGRFSEKHLRHLSHCMPEKTGMHYFSRAYFRWKEEGKPGELDPYRWRVEHWYSICGVISNWGCFHAMNTSGWGGVWERQEMMREQVEWMDEVLYDDPPMVDDFGDPFDFGGGGDDAFGGFGVEEVDDD